MSALRLEGFGFEDHTLRTDAVTSITFPSTDPIHLPHANPDPENERGATELLLRCGFVLTHLPTEYEPQGSAAPYPMFLPNLVV